MCRTLAHLKPDTYSESSQRFWMEYFAKIIQNYNYFSKALHLRSVTGSQYLSISTHQLVEWLCIAWCIFRSLLIIINPDIFRYIHVQFRHIKPYCGILRTLCNCFIFRIMAYLEPKIHSEFCQARNIQVHSERCETLACWEPCQIQNFVKILVLAYLVT